MATFNNSLIIIVYFLPTYELYIISQCMRCLLLYLFIAGRWITVKQACLPWQSVTLLMVFFKIFNQDTNKNFLKYQHIYKTVDSK